MNRKTLIVEVIGVLVIAIGALAGVWITASITKSSSSGWSMVTGVVGGGVVGTVFRLAVQQKAGCSHKNRQPKMN